MSKYCEWDNFKHLYLEDSYVLEINETEDQISFTLEIVLTEKHPFYKPPNVGEQYCYRNGKIIFQNLISVKWLNKNMQSFFDANESRDYGNIDLFVLIPDGYHLMGDWGDVLINSSPPKVVWLNDDLT